MDFSKEVLEKLTSIETKVQDTNTSLMKVVYALIGVIGASLGLKFVNSPVHTVIFAFVSFFAGTYLLASTIGQWKYMGWYLRTLRAFFTIFIYFSVICRTFIFESGITLAPEWYSPLVDSFFIIICILLLIISWKFWDNGNTGHKK
jgi:hypothetical protein